MYIFVFYTLLISIFFSLFIKFNPDFIKNFSENIGKTISDFSENIFDFELSEKFFNNEKNFSDDKKNSEKNILDNKNFQISEKKINQNIFEDFKLFENRWDFYAKKNFIELAINEYNRSILEINKIEEYLKKNISNKIKLENNLKKLLDSKKILFEKLYKNQNLIWDFVKAEKNILNLISISSDEKFLFDLIRNKINQKDLEKAKLILNRVKNKNYKYFYFDFILNLDINSDKKVFEEKFKNLKYLTLKYWDENYKSKIFALNSAIEEFKVYRDSQDIHLYTLLSKALTNSFEFEVSNKILWEVLRKREDYRDARIIFAYNKIRQWEAEKWLNILIWAENIDPTKPEIQFYKAIAYEDLWDLIKSKHNFLTALKNWYEPKSQIYQKLAEIYFKEWDFWESVIFYKKMLSVNSEKIEYFLLPFEIAIEKQKDFWLALKIAQWAKRRHPENALSDSILWYWYFLNWDIENAKKYLIKSLKLDTNLARNYLYAWEISMQEWQIANALKQFELAYKKDPNGKIWEKAIRFYNELIK